jgi:multiple sugar transport system permease protein
LERVERLPLPPENPRPLVAPLRVRISTGLVPYLFILPKLIFFLVFMLLPLGWAMVMSFQSGPILKGPYFVGIDNYVKIFRDELFWISLRNSFSYAVRVIPLTLGAGLFLAALLNRKIRFRPFYIALLIIPTVTSTVAASVIWGYLLNTDVGLFNTVLRSLGRPAVNWLGTPNLVMSIFVGLEMWRGMGFYAILFLAAMQSIPKHLYDAAAIDGATGVQAFWLVTLPLMRPTILFATVMATIWELQLFDSPYVVTKGGPGYASMTIVMYIYKMAFKFDAMGAAATMAIILLVIIMILAVLQLTFFRKEIQF